MIAGMEWELTKLKIDDFHREAERDRLARQALDARNSGAIDATPFRERLARLLGGFSPLQSRGPRLAGA